MKKLVLFNFIVRKKLSHFAEVRQLFWLSGCDLFGFFGFQVLTVFYNKKYSVDPRLTANEDDSSVAYARTIQMC